MATAKYVIHGDKEKIFIYLIRLQSKERICPVFFLFYKYCLDSKYFHILSLTSVITLLF